MGDVTDSLPTSGSRWAERLRFLSRPVSSVDRVDTMSWLADPSSLDEVARANFSIVRRGFDREEVQAFAMTMSAELGRMQSETRRLAKALRESQDKASERITEATVAGFLGDETSKMMEVAREAADRLQEQARQRAEALTAESQAEASRVLADARANGARTGNSADQYAAKTRDDVDRHAEVTRQQADDYAVATRQEVETYALRTRQDADEYAGQVRGDVDAYVADVRAEADTYVAHATSEAADHAELVKRKADDNASRAMSQARADSDGMRRKAEGEAANLTALTKAEADTTRRKADGFAVRTRAAAVAEGESLRHAAAAEATRLVSEATEHRVEILRQLARRRDLACAQVRSMLTGRDLIVDALDQVRVATTGLIDHLSELSTAPADFVSLDPEIEGPGLVMDKGASLSVRRGRPVASNGHVEPEVISVSSSPNASNPSGAPRENGTRPRVTRNGRAAPPATVPS